jgi:hypothetical protein
MRTIKKPKTMGVKKVSQKKSVKELELDLQQTQAEMEQLHGGSSSWHLDEMDRLRKAIRKLK